MQRRVEKYEPLGPVNITASPMEGCRKEAQKLTRLVVGDEDGVEQLRQFDSLEEGEAAERDNFIHISMFPCSYL